MVSAQDILESVSSKKYRERKKGKVGSIKSSQEPAQSFIQSRRVRIIKRPRWQRALLRAKQRYVAPASKSFFRGTGGVVSGIAQMRKRQVSYARQIRRPIIGSGYKKKFGGRGRPQGSYDPRYEQFGGVYGFRKYQAQALRLQRMQIAREVAVTPQEQQILSQIKARQRAYQQNPENQIIPDTQGIVRTKSIHEEIEDAANIIP